MAVSFSHKRGDTFTYSATLKNSATGAVVDLTGYSIAAKIRQADLTEVFTFSPSIDTPATAGIYSMSATAAQTATWAVGTHQLDVEFTDGSGTVTSTDTMAFTVVQDITY